MHDADDGTGFDLAPSPAGPAEDLPVYYAQETMVGASFFDFSLVFFQESFRGNRPVANVTLPPAAAKKLARDLAEYLEAYEQELGEIRLPPELDEDEDEDEVS